MGVWVVRPPSVPLPDPHQAGRRPRSISDVGWKNPLATPTPGSTFSFHRISDDPLAGTPPPPWNYDPIGLEPARPMGTPRDRSGREPMGERPEGPNREPRGPGRPRPPWGDDDEGAGGGVGISRMAVWQSWLQRMKSMLAQYPLATPDFSGPEPTYFKPYDVTGIETMTAPPFGYPPSPKAGPGKPGGPPIIPQPTGPLAYPMLTFRGLGI